MTQVEEQVGATEQRVDLRHRNVAVHDRYVVAEPEPRDVGIQIVIVVARTYHEVQDSRIVLDVAGQPLQHSHVSLVRLDDTERGEQQGVVEIAAEARGQGTTRGLAIDGRHRPRSVGNHVDRRGSPDRSDMSGQEPAVHDDVPRAPQHETG